MKVNQWDLGIVVAFCDLRMNIFRFTDYVLCKCNVNLKTSDWSLFQKGATAAVVQTAPWESTEAEAGESETESERWRRFWPNTAHKPGDSSSSIGTAEKRASSTASKRRAPSAASAARGQKGEDAQPKYELVQHLLSDDVTLLLICVNVNGFAAKHLPHQRSLSFGEVLFGCTVNSWLIVSACKCIISY